MKKITVLIIIFCGIIFIGTVLLWGSTYHPLEIEKIPVTKRSEVDIKHDNDLKIMTWNIQFMAGKNYLFYYDLWNGKGPDKRPSREDLDTTIESVAEMIRSENPDVILLQELHDGAKATDYEDQMEKLMKLLPEEYSDYTSAYYWKAGFVPHPMIMGSVGMKLGIISKYNIIDSTRYQLPQMPNNFVIRELQFKRAVLDAEIELEKGKRVHVLNTHFDAFSQGSDTMQRQVEYTYNLLKKMNKKNEKWLMGGDFNLLPPLKKCYDLLPDDEKMYFQKESEIKKLYEEFKVIPSIEDITGKDYEKWRTHYPNRAKNGEPDRIIDYVFYSDTLELKNSYVIQEGAINISDHLPIISVFNIE